MTETKILCVGKICLDIICVCKTYPVEDTDQRCQRMEWQKGGNAANTSAVLGMLGNRVNLFGVIPAAKDCKEIFQKTAVEFVCKEMEQCGVCLENMSQLSDMILPCSNVIINDATGSRTIQHHHSGGEEPLFEDFREIDISSYSWIHFEGRNVGEVSKMVSFVVNHNQESLNTLQEPIKISVELEKPQKPNLHLLFPHADVVVISQVYARYFGHQTALAAVEAFKLQTKTGAFVVCCWGEAGAACGVAGVPNDAIMIPAFSPAKVIDTLGAGDTFLAGLIHALIRGKDLPSAVRFACLIAGHKTGSYGYDCLRNMFNGSSLDGSIQYD